MSKWYGSLNNRLEEGKQFCDEIKVGTGVTEYCYSDRRAYEVIEVKNQKHIVIRELDHHLIGEAFTNNWELTSNENNPSIPLVKRGNNWYIEKVATIEDIQSDDICVKLWLIHNGFDIETIKAKGSQKKYQKMNISIGKANFHYDYEF